MKTTNLENGTVKIETEHGSCSLPEKLWDLFAACDAPTRVTEIVAKARTRGFTNGYVRSVVQQLSQPGQYRGSSCIGAINTSTEGRKLFVQIAKDGAAPARPKLTRQGKKVAETEDRTDAAASYPEAE